MAMPRRAFLKRSLAGAALAFAPHGRVIAADAGHRRFIDFDDPTYGSRIRQMYDAGGDEHNLYHYRTPFNVDNSLLLGIRTPASSADYQVALYDGDGSLLRKLFTVPEYGWKLAWDRHDPQVFYTERQNAVYRYNVAGKVELLRSFEPLLLSPAGLSLNQWGDRILVATQPDHMVRTFRLPAMDDERTFRVETPEGWYAGWDKLRFIGYQNFVAVTFMQQRPTPTGTQPQPPFTRIYDADSGEVVYRLEGISIGHHDFSPDGKLAYTQGHPRQGSFEIRLINIDGSDDRMLYEVPSNRLQFIRSAHITWPDVVNDWFMVSFFPDIRRLPEQYQPPLDELVRIHMDGSVTFLARTGTACGDNFWAQPQHSPSADGTLILFHTNAECRVGRLGYKSSGTIDQCILYLS